MNFEKKLEYEYSMMTKKNPMISQWEHENFSDIREKLEEENSFIENPIIDIEEGIIQCNKCKSYKTFSYQKQVRSSDEGFTLFVSCVDCNSSWCEN